jgi:carbamoyltransferase
MRDFWMPFAPTILDDWASKYIKDWDMIKDKAFDSTKYMIMTFDSTVVAQEHLRAAMHQKDKTLRPQIVSKEDSPLLYKLLKYYEELTGMGGCLNTSLNIHGYPLVGTLEQAIFTFENSGLEYLTLENFLLHKKN